MIRNYFKIAWRSLMKNIVFSLINTIGLSIGIAVSFIIFMFVQDELSFDKFNNNADRIARVIFQANINGGKINESNVMPPVAEAMKNHIPGVEDATRLMDYGGPKIILGTQTFKGDRLAFVDPDFFDIFTLPMIEGNANTALLQTNTIVITKATSEKYFGNENAIGKTIGLDSNKNSYTVTGVIENIPSNSHFHFDVFASMTGWKDANSDSWMRSGFYTYLLLKPGVDYNDMESQFPTMVAKYMGPQIQQQMGLSLEQFRTKGNSLGFALQPLTSIHLHSAT